MTYTIPSGRILPVQAKAGGGFEGVVSGGLSFVAETGFSISGTHADNSDITITDTSGSARFGVKPGGAAPLHLWDAEYGDVSWSALQRFSGVYSNQPAASYQTTVKPAEAFGALAYYLEPSLTVDHLFGDLPLNQDIAQITNVFVALRLQTNWDGADAYATDTAYNLKGVRHVSADASMSNSVPLWGQTASVDGNPRSSGFNVSAGNVLYHGDAVFGLDRFKNTWRTWEELGRLDYAGTNSLERVEIDGTREDYPGSTAQLAANNAPTFLSMFQKQNAWGLASHYLATGYIYVDDSWCSAFIVDQSAWVTNADHNRALCIPVAWTSDEITIRLRKRMHASLSGKSLFVRTSDGSMIKVGAWS